ncbi:UDP-glycosyltransferase UGT5-like [Periplaneta americana]|uniref:UDP-glycosyltransferase UGT5-like n=1 Tax=Periplaneta americana TaxID=6978 RepID=UPI0037E87A04
MNYLTVLTLVLHAVCYSTGARILAIIPMPSLSHQLPFQIIFKALAARGHEITVISPTPLKTPVPNYTDVDISFSHANYKSKFDFMGMTQTSAYRAMKNLFPYLSQLADQQLSSPPVQEFIRSNDSKFDLVFLQTLTFQSYYGLIHHVGSPPVIGIQPVEAIWTASSAVGNPLNPSYCPDILLPFSNHMTFYERLQNTLFWIWIRYFIHTVILPDQEAIMRKHFGPSPPPVVEAERNMSLFMLSTNWMFNYPIPLVPAFITFHSLHVKTQPDPLPQDLQQFLDEANEGVIYFSLGSNARSDHMPEEKIRVFLEVFSEVSIKVLWKWESDILPGQPSNVRTGKWLPQQDILAHRNVRLFITHCGAQSLQEAVYHAVPLLGIPIFHDQVHHAKKIEHEGIGIRLLFNDLTKETLLNAINEILSDSRYKNNMKRMSAIAKDEPQTSIDKAVWWTEYVLRHNGAKHLRSAAVDLTWYQYFLLDVLAFLFIIIILILYAVYICFTTIYRYLMQHISEIKSKRD